MLIAYVNAVIIVDVKNHTSDALFRSFGESTKLLHSFKEPFNEDAGAHILRDFTFEQKKTLIAKVISNVPILQ